MARRHSSAMIPRPVKKITNTLWELSNGVSEGLGAGAVGFNFSSAGTQPSTLLRIRGEIVAWIDGASAAAKGVYVSYGIILVPEGSGTTVRFNPQTDANAPWLLYGSGFIGYDEPVADAVDVPGITSFRHVIDNKAMRIIRPDVEMQLVITNTTVAGAVSVNAAYEMRWLQGF